MKSLLRDRLDDVIAKISENGIINNMKQLSEWCAFLDYCERTPLRLSEDLGFEQPDDGTIHPLWFVGYGIFGESRAILSVPSETWSPELYFLAGKWMGDYVQANPKLRSFFDLGEVANGDIGTSMAVMSWSDTEYLELMHNCNTGHDIGAGMVVFHKHPIEEPNEDNHCYLNWLPKFWPDEAGVRLALGDSKLAWMVESSEVSKVDVWYYIDLHFWLTLLLFYTTTTIDFQLNQFDNKNMLCKVDIADSIPTNHMDNFGEYIINLMNSQKMKKYA